MTSPIELWGIVAVVGRGARVLTARVVLVGSMDRTAATGVTLSGRTSTFSGRLRKSHLGLSPSLRGSINPFTPGDRQ